MLSLKKNFGLLKLKVKSEIEADQLVCKSYWAT